MNNQQFQSQTPYANNQQFQAQSQHTGNQQFQTQAPLSKNMKSQFSFFGIASAAYAIFYTFCLYKNASGITYPFFVAGTLCYFFLCMKKLGVPFKKDSLFYVISIVLLGISNCCTASVPILSLNKLGIFLLTFVLMLHTIYQDKLWGLPKYISAVFHTIGISLACIFYPFIDAASFFAAKKQQDMSKNNHLIYIIIGLAVAAPVLALMTALLCSADIVFREMISRLFSFDFIFIDFFKIAVWTVIVFFVSYALLSALCEKSVKENVSDKKILEPMIAIIITGSLSAVYLIFSMIQILYLFIGNMRLPEGYTYSAYARQGFFQLLIVCVLNLIIVLMCLSLFKDNTVLKVILTVICSCTFIMILSSVLRMLMYIKTYNLTFLRLFVLWSLAVIFLLMAGVTVYIYFQRFPLFFYSVAVTTVLYIGLSFAHPDYWIASYNLKQASIDWQDEDTSANLRYLTNLSADAAPVLLNEKANPYLQIPLETMEEFAEFEMIYDFGNNDFSYDKYDEIYSEIDSVIQSDNERYLYRYYKKVYKASKEMRIRNFNFSVFFAGRSV